jgi:hypothetical protein
MMNCLRENIVCVPVQPDPKQALTFFAALFPKSQGDVLHFRAVPEPARVYENGRREPPKNLHYALDGNFASTVEGFLEWCNIDQRAAFFLPGFVTTGGTGKADVLSMPAFTVDFDKGDPAASLASLEAAIGPATIIVESGGMTEHGPKLHAYWRLSKPAVSGEIDTLCKAREAAALAYGGDPAFKQPAQVIRVPGSVHRKGDPVLVRLRAVRPELEYELPALAEKLLKASEAPAKERAPIQVAADWFNFNTADVGTSHAAANDLRDVYVETEGKSGVTRWEWFNKVAGAEIADARAGRKSLDAARDYVKGKVLSHFECPEDWDDARIDREFDALVKCDIKNNGPFLSVAPVVTGKASGLRLTDWYARKQMKGKAPERRWLVEGLIPCGTPGVFASPGDTGKSMLALKLALQVSCTPRDSSVMQTANPTFFSCPVVGRGTVVFLTGEDDISEVHRRLNSLDPSGRWEGEDAKLIIVPMLSTGGARAIVTDGPQGPMITPFWEELRAQLFELPELALVIVDPLTQFFGGNINDNTLAAAFMAELNLVASKTGAAVLLLHHLSKSADNGNGTRSAGRNGIMGASAFVNNARFAIMLEEATEDSAYKALKALGQPERAKQSGIVYCGGLVKSNAPAAKVTRWFVRDQNGVLQDETVRVVQDTKDRLGAVDEIIHRELLKRKAADPRYSFTKSPSALQSEWGSIVEEHDLPVTKEGKGKGAVSVTAVFGRLLAAGKLARTADRTERYEPVEAA